MKCLKFMLLPLLYSNPCLADWFCKEGASKASGDTFYACGHSVDKSLASARENSLLAAKREFQAFCRDSVNCKDRSFTVSPLRTDCGQIGELFSCHRGIEYTLREKRSDIDSSNRVEIASKIQIKQKELSQLQTEAAQIRKLQELEDKINSLKNREPSNNRPIVLQETLPVTSPVKYEQGISLKLVGVGTSLKEDSSEKSENVTLGGFGGEYDFQIWNNIALRSSLSFVFGNKESELKDRGEANSKSALQYHSHQGIDANLSLPISFLGVSINPTVGYLGLSYKSTQYAYNQYGVGLDKTESKHSYSSGYSGLGVRVGTKYFIDLEARHFFKDNKNSTALSFGVRVDF